MSITLEDVILSKYPVKYPLDCKELDKDIINMQVELSEIATEIASGNKTRENYYNVLNNEYYQRKILFDKQNCTFTLESIKLRESANILSSNFKLSDMDVLGKSEKERNLLYLIGGGVILFGLFLILK